MDKKFIDILPKIADYETIPYSPSLNCPNCEKSGFFRELGMKEKPHKPNLVGWCDTPQGFMAVFECVDCFEKFRFHYNMGKKFDIDDFDFDVGCLACYDRVANGKELWEKYENYNKKE